MAVIEIDHLTKDYGHNRGVFDITFSVEKGEVYGFLGPNGAGKTTAIRHIMGFSKPQKGFTAVNGLNSWQHASDIQRTLGYLPGEIALPENLTGNQFIEMMTRLRGMKDLAYTHKLMEQFELEPSGSLKRMSLGMKRKLAIVTAFMHDPDVLVLDEPTSGLDPIMQHRFIDFILQEKKRGKTILLSSHIFNEIDATCDKISMIKDGHIIASFIADELRNSSVKTYKVELISDEQFSRLYQKANGEAAIEILKADADKKQVIVRVDGSSINALIALLAEVDMKFFSEIKFTLEDYFMRFYDRNLHETEVISS
ncbi:ABC transporter ATP-binding protein [Paenibacillus sp. FSL H8-0548]|uniref:ABC transporter ATP-binding protein n=1 Tax=Paenibacillus sp. FSL H8-0548 TaxID=1920422 RepID=UPI00096CBEA7|nr:ABC transporter ATP-binding protein [Paenibacillus sp. FSL H8-0548]OMF34662.1 ABC transporter ATP-binding protein [Paenibacillus sp. FSL H8-0548]